MEGDVGRPATFDLAQRLSQKLDVLDSEFRTHHHALIDLVDDQETLRKEQSTLDDHDDLVTDVAVRIQQLINACSSTPEVSARKIASRRLSHLEKTLSSIRAAISSLSGESDDFCVLRQYEEQFSDCKREPLDVRSSLLTLDLEDSDELCTSQTSLEDEMFQCSLKIKRLLHASTHPHEPTTRPTGGDGVRLPKLDVPTFDGSILNWRSFWEQFGISVHHRSNLSDSEKLVYLQHSLKDGSVKNIIEGLSRSGEHYTEAIECLQSRYDRPRLIHQAHVPAILEAPSPEQRGSLQLMKEDDL